MTNPDSFRSRVPGDSGRSRAAADSAENDERERPLVRDEDGYFSTAPTVERAVLVGVEIRDHPGLLPLSDSLDELELLADTAGIAVVGTLTQKLDSPHPATLLGSGKVEELKSLVIELGANAVILDDELSPRQQR